MLSPFIRHPSSYRDPSGFIFLKEGILYRQINKIYKEHFDHFITSGCYERLAGKKLLIPHEVINENLTGSADWYLTLKPDRIPFISYPYEWSFDMLKDAALLTLALVKKSLQSGMILKDATPYNIQWHNGKLIFIDTLSFEKYNPEEPWIAYRQFCENFLGPLLLMHYNKIPLQPLQLAWPEGIPLAVTKSLLPFKSKFSLFVYLHIFLHERVSSNTQKTTNKKERKFSKQKLLNLISSLEGLITRLKAPDKKSTWSAYYEEAAQRTNYLDAKKEIITDWLNQFPESKTAIDLGANDGEFSKLLAAKNIAVLSADFDSNCINTLYREIKKTGEKNIQPLIADLSNPAPATGFNNEERASFITRANADIGLALALIHHLAIGKNIPFAMLAVFFKKVCNIVIIEFVPKEDEKVQLILAGKKDIYTDYDEIHFTGEFEKHFHILEKKQIAGSGRILYLMIRHEK